jgi:hypothetical protein
LEVLATAFQQVPCIGFRAPSTDHEASPIDEITHRLANYEAEPSATKVRPIRFFCIQAILHSRTEESFAITSRKHGGTKAGFSTSMAAPSGEMFLTMQLMTEPPDDT